MTASVIFTSLAMSAALNPVIPLQSPKPNSLRQKAENKRSDFGLKNVTDGDARRRIRRIDYLKNMLCDQLWLRRILHISTDRGPRFRNSCFISRIVFRGC